MKKNACILLFAFISYAAHSQGFVQKDVIVNLGAGLSKDFSHYDPSYKRAFPVSASVEYIIYPHLKATRGSLGLGAETAFFQYKIAGQMYHVVKVGLFINAHYAITTQLSAFGGVMPSILLSNYSGQVDGVEGYTGMEQEIFGGIAWYPYSRLGLFIQLSTAETMVKTGLSLKF